MILSRAHALRATSRKRIGIAALSGAEPVARLARRHGTSRKFVRAQRERAGHALELAFVESRALLLVEPWGSNSSILLFNFVGSRVSTSLR